MEALKKVWLNLTSLERLLLNFRAISNKVIVTKIKFPWLCLKMYSSYRHVKVPFRQVLILDSALTVQKELESAKIGFVICGGTLLGAVRQGALAGRPADFDLAIKETDLEKLLLLKPNFEKFRLRLINHEVSSPRNKTRFGGITIMPNSFHKFYALRCQIHISIYELRDGAWHYRRWRQDPTNPDRKERQATLDFPSSLTGLTATVFGYKFPIPNNYEQNLITIYGQGWRTPNSKQYSWRTPAINKSSVA